MDPNVWGPGAWTTIIQLHWDLRPNKPTYLDKQRQQSVF